MEKKYRQLDGELRLMEDKNPLFYRVELWLLNAKDNRNKWRFINLEKHMRKFAGTPVLTAYVKGGEQVGDGHNFRMVPDPETGDMVPTFTDATAERIVGAINEDADDMSMRKDGEGVEWIVGIAKIWKWYARELVAKIKEAAKQGAASRYPLKRSSLKATWTATWRWRPSMKSSARPFWAIILRLPWLTRESKRCRRSRRSLKS